MYTMLPAMISFTFPCNHTDCIDLTQACDTWVMWEQRLAHILIQRNQSIMQAVELAEIPVPAQS